MNQKSYIGLTSNEYNRKKKAHKHNIKTRYNYFYSAVKSYGWDSFEYSILYYGLTYDDIINTEIELIDTYDTYNNGYNLTKGGEGTRGFVISGDNKNKISMRFRKKVYQYTLSGEYIRSFDSIVLAKNTIDTGSITAPLDDNTRSAGGFLWTTVYYTKLSPYASYNDTISVGVSKIGSNGEKIESYISISYAARSLGGNYRSKASGIRRACNRDNNKYHGHYWVLDN